MPNPKMRNLWFLALACGLALTVSTVRGDDIDVLKAEVAAAKLKADAARDQANKAAVTVRATYAEYNKAVVVETSKKAEYEKIKAKADVPGPNQAKAKDAVPLFKAEWDDAAAVTVTTKAAWEAAKADYERLNTIAVDEYRIYVRLNEPLKQRIEIARLKTENATQQTEIDDLKKRVTKLEQGLKTEKDERVAGDQKLDQAIKTETEQRKTADSDLQKQIDALRGDIKAALEGIGELKVADMKMAEKLAATAGDVEKLSASLTATRADLLAYKTLLEKAIADAKTVQPIVIVTTAPVNDYQGYAIPVGTTCYQYPAYYEVHPVRRAGPVVRAAAWTFTPRLAQLVQHRRGNS